MNKTLFTADKRCFPDRQFEVFFFVVVFFAWYGVSVGEIFLMSSIAKITL